MSANYFLSRAIRAALLAGAAATVAVPAMAAEEDESIQEIVVTGSRIKSLSVESASPMQVVGSADIETSGVANIQDLLLKNPTFGTPTLSRTNSNFLTSSAGVATIDLRNLGIDRTLVLVNGRRFVSGIPGSAAVDLNTIPTQFIERVEVLTGGASAVYGSDAVAGVVNIIYKQDFEGVALDTQYGESAEGDDEQKQIGLTLGVNSADGKGNMMVYMGYTDQGAVYSADRKRSAVDQYSLGAGFTGDPADFFTPVRPYYSGFAPQGYFYTDNDIITYDAAGNVIPADTNGTTSAATGFNRNGVRTIAVPTERYLLAGRGSYEFTDGHRAFFEGTYASTQTQSRLEPFPLGSESIYPDSGGQVPAEFLVNGVLLRNPIVPDEVYNDITDNDGDGLADYYFARRLSDIANRGNRANRDTFRIVAGAEGDIAGDWTYEAYYSYGQTKEAQTSTGQVNVLNFRNALEAIPDVDDIDGDGDVTEAICRDANARAQGCVPINLFGFNSISPAAAQYVQAPGMLSTVTTQKVAGLNFTGTVFDLPAGPFAVAVGAEYRDEYALSEFDPLQQAGLNAGNAIPPTEGDFDVLEGYLELDVPLLADLPAIDSLTARGAVRFSDYSTVGNTVSWNAGLEWSPIPQVRFRAIRALSTRAPNISELYDPPSQTFPTGLNDPCLGVTATSTTSSSDACRADPGVAANIAANGAFTLTQADLQGVSGYNRGNPDLEEEEGKSWTIGVVLTPDGIPVLENFAFTIDYFDIDIEQAIVSTPRQFILDQCYSGDAAFCSFITRRQAAQGNTSAGSLEYIDSAGTNSGGYSTEGIDLTVDYGQDIGPGRLNARLSYTHLLDGYVVPLPGADKDPFAGEIGSSEDRAYLQLGYAFNDISVTWQTTYIGPADLDDQFLSGYDLAPGSVGIGSWLYHDLQASYNAWDTVQFYLGVNNVFDNDPPPIISGLPFDVTGTETAAGTYDAIGRRYYGGFRMKF